MRLADGTHIGPTEVPFLDTANAPLIEVVMRFKPTVECTALVRTVLEIEADAYRTHHTVIVIGAVPAGAQWIEGGFPLATDANVAVTQTAQANRAAASAPNFGRIATEIIKGWHTLHGSDELPALCPQVDFSSPFNLLRANATHFLLTAPIAPGRSVLAARHSAGAGDAPEDS
jgi:hypothetical protein